MSAYPMTLPLPRNSAVRTPWLWRSLATRLALLALVFLAVPVLIYEQFRRADEVSQTLLLQSARQQGQLIAKAIEPDLKPTDHTALAQVAEVLARFADDHTRLRLLVRPRAISGSDGFFYVGPAAAASNADLDTERRRLIEQGVLDRLELSCDGDIPLALRVPRTSGAEELLTSITPMNTAFGCWALVTSSDTEALLGSSLGRPYWRTTTVQAAALIYIAMAGLVMAVLFGVLRNLRRFRDLARGMVSGEAPGESFARRNTVPELAGVAEAFDTLVETLHQSAVSLRRAAEDNAHAFKTPIAVIRQSTEPLRRAVPGEDLRCRRALAMIETSLDKLDGLVSFSRRMDEATADLLEPPRKKVNLSALVERMANSYAGLLAERAVHLRSNIQPGMVVRASEDILETVVENIVENAVSFSPPGATVSVSLARQGGAVELAVKDEGPGVDPGNLPRIFERYFSQRETGQTAPTDQTAQGTHFGIGLWIVRRNVEAVGGRVLAENREPHGFCLRIVLPLAG